MAEFNVPNKTILIGDCLKHLSGINSDSVDLIYLDPPFNKNRRFFAPTKKNKKSEGKKRLFDDVWHAKHHKDKLVEYLDRAGKENEELCDWLRSVKAIDPDRQDRNYCYLVYMAIRLLECRRILKPTGSIFLHCDDTMSHWLKITLDCIFDEENFRNEIIWRRTSSTHADAKNRTGRITDSIFWYSKSAQAFFKGFYQRIEPTPDMFPLVVKGRPAKDNGPIMRSRTRDLPKSLDYTWRGIKPKYGWDVTEDKLERYYQEGKVIIKKTRGGGVTVRRVVTADDYPGKKLGNLWTGVYLKASEQGEYATQKPEELLERIILATTDKRGVVVDPFCGCATTCVAADNNERHWVGIDIEPGAKEEIERRLPTVIREIECTTMKPVRTDGNRPSQETRWVYILRDQSEPDWHKIGIAKNWRSRENSYRTGKRRRESIKFVYKVETSRFRELERHLIETFENDHEWLNASVNQIKKEIQHFLAGNER